MTERICETCQHFQPETGHWYGTQTELPDGALKSTGGFYMGECRALPPRTPRYWETANNVWPPVRPLDWCSHWTPKGGAK